MPWNRNIYFNVRFHQKENRIGERISMDLFNQSNEDGLYSEYKSLINSSDDSIFAFEAIMRSNLIIDPHIMFQQARNNGKLYELDSIYITNAIKGYPFFNINKYLLFINILPSTIVHDDFENFVNRLLLDFPNIRGCVVFELNGDVNEENIWRQSIFSRRLSYLQTLGFKISFDNLPIAQSSFEKIEEFAPDFVKIDYTIAKGLSNSLEKQELIALFLKLMDQLNPTHQKMKLILAGIETEQDFLAAKILGVPLIQNATILQSRSTQTISIGEKNFT